MIHVKDASNVIYSSLELHRLFYFQKMFYALRFLSLDLSMNKSASVLCIKS
jgi:hypothetical protein